LLGAPAGGFLLSFVGGGEHNSTTFMVIFAITAVTGVMAFVLGAKTLLKEEQTESSKGSKLAGFLSGIREVGSDKRVLVTSSMEGARHLALGALEAFLPIYAVTVAGLSAFHAGLLFAVQIIATMVAKPVMGRYSDRYGRKYFIVVGLFCCALPITCIPWLTSFSYLLIACLIFGLGEAFVTSSAAALVADFCKAKQYGTAMGVFGTIYDVGHAAGPILGGILVGGLGYAAAFGVLGGLLLFAVPVFLHVLRTE
jgi:MFS family permease